MINNTYMGYSDPNLQKFLTEFFFDVQHFQSKGCMMEWPHSLTCSLETPPLMAAHGTSRFFMILQSFPPKHLASSEEPLAQGAQILRLVVGWYLRSSPMAQDMLKQEEFFEAFHWWHGTPSMFTHLWQVLEGTGLIIIIEQFFVSTWNASDIERQLYIILGSILDKIWCARSQRQAIQTKIPLHKIWKQPKFF